MKKSSLFALVLLTAAVGVSAEENTADTTAAAPNPKDKVKCRSEKVTGSRSKVRRTCRTVAQWEQIAEQTRKGLDEMNRNAAGGAKHSMDTGAMAAMGGT